MNSNVKIIISRILSEKMRERKSKCLNEFNVKEDGFKRSDIVKCGFYNLFLFISSLLFLSFVMSTHPLKGNISTFNEVFNYTMHGLAFLMIIVSAFYFVIIERAAYVSILLEKIENAYSYIYKNIDSYIMKNEEGYYFEKIKINKGFNIEDVNLDLNDSVLNNEEVLKYLKDVPIEDLQSKLLNEKGEVSLIKYMNYKS